MATIEIKPGRYFAAIVFIGGKHPRDYLAAVWRDVEGPWHLDYRFRYYKDSKNFDSDDEKSAYSVTMDRDVPEEKVVATVRMIAEMLVEEDFNEKLTFLEPKSDDPQVVGELFIKQPWAHLQPTGIGGDA